MRGRAVIGARRGRRPLPPGATLARGPERRQARRLRRLLHGDAVPRRERRARPAPGTGATPLEITGLFASEVGGGGRGRLEMKQSLGTFTLNFP